MRLILLIAVVLMSSCSLKMPLPTEDESGIFIIPISAINETNRSFISRYRLIYTPDSGVNMVFFPKVGRNFVVIEDFPVGKYQVEGLGSMGGTRPGVETSGGFNEQKFRKPFPFEIEDNKIFIFPVTVSIRQVWANPDDSWYQSISLNPMDSEQIDKLKSEIKQVPNAEHWDFSN